MRSIFQNQHGLARNSLSGRWEGRKEIKCGKKLQVEHIADSFSSLSISLGEMKIIL